MQYLKVVKMYKQISPGDGMYSMMTIFNNIIYLKVVKRVNI